MEEAAAADRTTLAARIADRCLLQGSFQLRSGQTATHYFDKYLFEADPLLLAPVAELAGELIPAGTDVLAGLELGGVPIATAMSLRTGLPVAFVRKEAKPYGTAKLAEGAEVDGRVVVVVEDVLTTGGQVVASTRELRARGAVVDTVLCVIDRSGGHHRLRDEGLGLLSLFSADGRGLR